MLNQVVICGRLTKDPEIRQLEDGKTKVASFTLAVDRDYVTSSGERSTDFIDCEAWRGAADFLGKHFRKGDMMQVVGRLVCKKWMNKEGTMRYSMVVRAETLYFGESRRSREARAGGPEQEYPLPPINEPVPPQEQNRGYADYPEDFPICPPNTGYNNY